MRSGTDIIRPIATTSASAGRRATVTLFAPHFNTPAKYRSKDRRQIQNCHVSNHWANGKEGLLHG
jgi:hypothetical protein